MATKAKSAKKALDPFHEEEIKNDWQRLVESIKEYPAYYAAGVLFIVLCTVAGLVYRVSANSKDRAATTEFARALGTEDPALRASELEQVAQRGPRSAQALYMAAEAAYQAKNYDKASELFQRLRDQHNQFQFTPDAVEGLGFIAENKGELDTALDAYKEVVEKWPASVASRRQQMNIARVQENKNNPAAAVEAYKLLVERYPDSSFKDEAETALARLERANPELFPEEAEPEIQAEEQPADQSNEDVPEVAPVPAPEQ